MRGTPRLSRRRLLAGTSAVFLAGTAGLGGGGDGGSGATTTTASEQTTPTPENETDTPTPQNGTGTSTQENETDTTTPTGTSTIDLEVSETGVTTVDSVLGERVHGDATVTNHGTMRTDSFTLGLDWIDDAGAYVATTDVSGMFLDGGQSWRVRHPAWLDVENPETIDAVEATITEMDPLGELVPNPDGIELVESTVRAGEDEVVVRGRIRNDRETTEYVEAAGKVLAENGDMLAIADTIDEVPSGGTWRFEMNPRSYGRNDQVDSGTVIPYLSAL